MHPLLMLLRGIDRFTDLCGRTLAWLTLAMVLLTSLVVVLRYGLDIGAVALQEAITYAHGAVFMLGAAYTLKLGGHVRVDMLYRRWSPRRQAWVDSIGTIVLLLPFCAFLLWVSWDFVAQSWAYREVSSEPGGLPAVYLLKALIPLLAITLALQGFAELLRAAQRLMTDGGDR